MARAVIATLPAPARSPVLQTWIPMVLACIALLIVTAWRIVQSYETQFRHSQATTENLAHSLADKAHSTVHSTAIIVADIAERVEHDGWEKPALARLHTVLVAFVANKRSLNDIVVFTAGGDGIETSLEPMPKVNVSDRSYFIYHRDHDDTAPLVGAPFRNRGEGRWSIPVSRRIDNPDGSFAGVVVALIDCEAMNRFYRDFDIGPHGMIWLMRDDATLLVRQPPIPGTLGQNLASSPLVQEYYEHGPVGSSEYVSQVDHQVQLGSYHKVDDYPLVIFVSAAKDDFLRSWRSDSCVALAMAIVLSAVLSILIWRLSRQFCLRDKADADVRQSARQYRLLADNCTDVIIQFGADGRRQYVSPAVERVLGYQPAEMLGGHPRNTVHPEDFARVEASMMRVQATGYATPITYRVRRKDGVYVWVETQGRKLLGEDGFVVTIRDITSRKRIEAQLHKANARLQQIVAQDELTGVANRRGLDINLKKEWERARRYRTPVAMLMIDIDALKALNDRYGYEAGDACLVAVAAAIAGQTRRVTDIVARYGGEEFVVVMPDTAVAGATATAGNIRTAIRHLAIPNSDLPPSIVTASIGVAVLWPSAGEGGEQELLHMADAALRRAKKRGGDSTCVNAAEIAATCEKDLLASHGQR